MESLVKSLGGFFSLSHSFLYKKTEMIRFESGRDRVWESTRGSGNHTIPVGHVEGGTRHFRWESTLDPSAHERFVGMLISSTPFSSLTRSYDAALIFRSGFSIRFTCFHLFSVRLVWLIFIWNWSKWLIIIIF